MRSQEPLACRQLDRLQGRDDALAPQAVKQRTNDAMANERRWPVAPVASKNRKAVTIEESSLSRPFGGRKATEPAHQQQVVLL
jgi:hypothetical protein